MTQFRDCAFAFRSKAIETNPLACGMARGDGPFHQCHILSLTHYYVSRTIQLCVLRETY